MNDVNRLKVLIYEFLLFELSRLEDAADEYRHLMCLDASDAYSVLKYYSSLNRLEAFRVFMKKICKILDTFG